MSRRRFVLALAAIGAVALLVRVVYVVAVAGKRPLGQDALWYTLVSGPLSHGKGYLSPGPFFTTGRAIATAGYPPLYPAFLAVVTRLANGDHQTFRVAGAVAGVVTVVVAGVIGRRLGRARVGLLAAALVAVFPSLIAVDGALMSETVSIPLLYGAVLCVIAAIERPQWWRFVIAGGLFGAMLLARADAFIPALFVLGASALALRKIMLPALAIAAMVVVALPWVVRNEVRVHTPAIATISSAATIAGANCSTTYRGRLLGFWDLGCMDAARQSVLGEANWSHEARTQGLHYVRAHATRVPVVLMARELRALGLYHPLAQARLEALEGRSYRWQVLAWVVWLPAMVLGAIGLVRLARADRRAWPIAGAVVSMFVTVALAYGNQRFRTAIEPAMLIGVAVAAEPLLRRVSERS